MKTNNDQKIDEQIAQQERVLVRTNFYINDLESLIQNICSDDLLKVHYGITGIRNIISQIENIQHIQRIIDQNVIPKIFQLIRQNAHPLIVKQAAWTITNLLSGTKEQTQFIIILGVLEILLQLLYSKHQDIAELAVWGLSNMVAESTHTDQIIQHIDQINLIYQNANKDGKQTCIWTISNIIKYLPQNLQNGYKQQIHDCVPIICDFIIKFPNYFDYLYDSYVTLYEICQILHNHKVGITQIFSLEIVPVLIERLNHQSEERFIGILLQILQILIQYDKDDYIMKNISTKIPLLLGHHNLEIRQKTLNILMKYNNRKQISEEDVLLVQKICLIIQQDDLFTKKQSIKVLINYLKNPQFSVILAQTKSMIVSLIIPFLSDDKIEEIIEIFDLLEQFLQLGEFHKILLQEYQIDENPCLVELQNQGGVEIIEQLQLHHHFQVYDRVIKIITKFMNGEEI
ncbi:hypothetical protein pb186bvf_018018 [Paramecium bursaria]